MNATRLIDFKETWSDGTLVQMIVWRLPAKTAERPHGLKYRLYCGRHGRCLVRYDNERGKGDHCHEGDQERAYLFNTLADLIADFRADVRRIAGDSDV